MRLSVHSKTVDETFFCCVKSLVETLKLISVKSVATVSMLNYSLDLCKKNSFCVAQ